jgi:hypothetical protein
MISIKAISAIVLTGLGAATVSTDVYLANQKPRPAGLEAVPVVEAPPPPAAPAPAAAPVAVAPAALPPLEIPPVMIVGRRPAARPPAKQEPAKQQEYVACSDWRSMANGPAARGVRTLCLRDVE